MVGLFVNKRHEEKNLEKVDYSSRPEGVKYFSSDKKGIDNLKESILKNGWDILTEVERKDGIIVLGCLKRVR